MGLADDIEKVIATSLDSHEEVVVLHSSLPHLQPPSANPRWQLMRALRRIVDRGITVALPVFTFSFCSGKPYHFRTSASETGLLGAWALDLVGFRRTPHPIYSFAVAGPRSAELQSLKNSTTFSDDSTFGWFESMNARVFMLGCSWEYCTQFHRYEEIHQVAYRYYKDFEGTCDLGDNLGQRLSRARMYVRNLALQPVNDWSTLIARLHGSPGMVRVPLWSGSVESVPCAEIAACANDLLQSDPWAVVRDREKSRAADRDRRSAAKDPPVRCAILGHSNLANANRCLHETLAPLLRDRRVETYTVPFGQLDQEIINTAAALHDLDADVTFFVDRLEDLVGQPNWFSAEAARLTEQTAIYAQRIVDYRAVSRGWIVVHTLASVTDAVDFNEDRSTILDALNETLVERLRGLENVYLLDFATMAATAGVRVSDARLWHLGRFPFTPAFDSIVATRWSGLVLDALGRSARSIVFDLDNTVWGGILGDDGKAALKVGGDYPGNAFAAFQEELKRLSGQGFALAVISKNDEANALDAMATLPAMVIRPDDLAGYRINWRSKPENLKELCDELSLGQRSVLFIDDNPIERELVRAELPDLVVLDLPADPAEYVRSLVNSPWISRLSLTKEDYQRVATYKTRAVIEKTRRGSAANLEGFYASLEMTLHVTPLTENNRSRILQLISKTNQFNATTRRYDGRDLDRLIGSGSDVLSLGLEDRFAPREEIGVLILDWQPDRSVVRIDTYLLSCRVLGRGLEAGVLAWTAEFAARRRASLLIGEIVETERNTPVRTLYSDAGFRPGEADGEWRLDIPLRAPGIPKWLRVAEHFSGGTVLAK